MKERWCVSAHNRTTTTDVKIILRKCNSFYNGLKLMYIKKNMPFWSVNFYKLKGNICRRLKLEKNKSEKSQVTFLKRKKSSFSIFGAFL